MRKLGSLPCFRFLAYNTVKNKIWLNDCLKISLVVFSKFKQIN